MLRTTKWKLEKAKVKVVFRLQFHAINVPQSGWDKLFICLVSSESGKIIAKTSKANVRNGTCKWADPIYETTRLLVDSRNKRYDDKLYKLLVGMGTSRASILGEAAINLADYADASIPLVISLPLHESDHGTVLHVTVQLLTAKTGFREFEQHFDRGLQSSNNLNLETEPSIATSSASELQISDDHGNKVNTKKDFGPESKELISAAEETDIHEEYSDSTVGSNASEKYYADKHDLSSIHESGDLNGPFRTQNTSIEKSDKSKHQRRRSDHFVDNDLAIAQEENHRLRGHLEMAESSISELKLELSALHSYANEMGIETQNVAHHLMAEISLGQKLEREIMVLRSECSKFRDELEHIKKMKSRSKITEQAPNNEGFRIFDQGNAPIHTGFHVSPPMAQDQVNRHQFTWVNGLLLVEDRIRELREKINTCFHESNLSFVLSDLDALLGIVQDLERVMVQELGFTRGFDSVQGKSLELLTQLDEAKAEKGNLIRKMDEMECYYEALVQELEENQKQLVGQFQSLRYEHSTCVYTISACKAETETMRHNMNNEILRFTEERHALGNVNEDLVKRVKATEALVRELEENRERILLEFQILRKEHLTCTGMISTCKMENELIRRDMNDRTLKFAKERDTLIGVNEDLEKRVTTAEALVKELEANRERFLGEFRSLKSEHSSCSETISTCKAETESIRHDMNDQISRLTEEQNALDDVNKELKQRATAAEARVQELEENHDRILGEFQSLKKEHSACAAAISTCKTETDSICYHKELEKRVLTADSLVQELEENLQNLRNEHSTCGDTVSTCKSETESLRNNMNDQMLKFANERHALVCANEELEKRVTAAEALVQELEENRERFLGEFRSLENEHSTCADTISTCKAETELIRQDVIHMNTKISKLSEEKHVLDRVSEELEKRVVIAEALVQDLEENREWILRDFESVTNEHLKCADTISACKAETESIRQDMNTEISKLTEEKHALDCVNEELEKRVASSESALTRARFNHSIAVTQLQKDLDMLSFQVSSMFETNQNLIKQTFSESMTPLSENTDENPSVRCDVHSDDKFHEVFCSNLYLDVYSKTLEETLFGLGVNADKLKELEAQKAEFCVLAKSNENIPEDLEIEIIWIVVKATFDELYDECNKLKNILSEQIIKTEEFKNIAKDLEKKEPEGPSESLRLVFMKEQCETTVQDLKQQLSVSKRQCDDILFKLQDALDEIESRKKSEASYLKKIQELSIKIAGSEAEVQSIQAELECACLNLACCKEEKQKIVASMQECEEEKLKSAFELSFLREQLSQKESQFEMSSSSSSSFQDLQRGLMQLHKANEEIRSMYPSFKDFPGHGNALERVLGLEMELAASLTAKKKSSIQFQSSFLKQHSDEEAILRSFGDINELIKDTLEIKRNYVNVETELKEMHERYTQLSLQFAEVEGERQKLMMTIKNVRSPRNLAHVNRSSSDSVDRNLM